MSRRHRQDEISFGSDSFLDILANIVGILIILIVVAGLRVSKAPVKSPESHSETQEVHSASIVSLPSKTDATDLFAPAPEFAIEKEQVVDPPTLSQELVDRVEDLKSRIETLDAQRAQLMTEEQQLASRATQVHQTVSTSRENLESEQANLTRGAQAIAELDHTLRTTEQELAVLQVTLDEALDVQPNTTILRHKLTPVGRQVKGKQILFLLTGGKVAVVPTEELLKAFMSKRELIIKRLLTTQRYTGTVGPVQGFKMDYIVDRVASSLVDELRYGRATVGARLSMWQLIPQRNVFTESAAQALHPNGRFMSALREADRDATLTFFVHPDSFALHRELQDFAHQQGFEVAAHPLISGQPISIVHAGSPLGTPSVAQ